METLTIEIIIIIAVVAAIAVLLIIRNMKDEKKLKQDLIEEEQAPFKEDDNAQEDSES